MILTCLLCDLMTDLLLRRPSVVVDGNAVYVRLETSDETVDGSSQERDDERWTDARVLDRLTPMAMVQPDSQCQWKAT